MSNSPKSKMARSALALVCCMIAGSGSAEEPKKSTADLREPVYRVTKQEPRVTPTTTAATSIVAPESRPAAAAAAANKSHPLDLPIQMAQKALARSQAEIADYTAILVKRERVNGHLNDEAYYSAKIRNEKKTDGQITTPFSVYLKFLKPTSVKGREVIYVKGHNNGKLIAHEGGLRGKFTPSLYLDPNGTLAMMGQRYPITEVGIERLCEKLLERANHDRVRSMCKVTTQPAKINKRAATRIEVVHPEKMSHLDFHLARVFIDDEYGVPVRYEAYDWPRKPGAPVTDNDLIEQFTYVRLKLNVGLTDEDFDPANPDYNMK